MLSRPALAVQSLGALAALGALAFWPPRSGTMMIVALGGADRDAAAVALAADARLLGRGPIAGSLLVVGDRAAIAARTGGRSIVVLGAPFLGCGHFGA